MYHTLHTQVLGITLVTSVFSLSCHAEVTRIVIDSRERPTFHGSEFGEVGPYEKIVGRIFGELNPSDARNAIINDIELAPRNQNGNVEYHATFTLIKPVDMNRSSGVLIYSVPNRGNQLTARAIQGGDPGDGFLYERGHSILYSGWQGDLKPRPGMETIKVPTATNRDGSSITGSLLFRFHDTPPGTSTLAIPSVYASVSLDTENAGLTRRTSDDSAVIPIAAQDWAFSDCNAVPFPGTPDPTQISIRGGFEPDLLYELVYTAKDPLVLGIGLAATRDTVSCFRYAKTGEPGEPEDLLEGAITHVVAQGISQAGNFIKTFLHLGFNEDESGSIVWDAVNPHIAARQLPINFRFARPGGAASMYEPGSEGVLWWSTYQDDARGLKPASLLDRCGRADVCPKIFETFGSAEFWGLRMSPGLVGTMADVDIPLPSNVRRYYFPGTTHGGGQGGFAIDTPPRRMFQLPGNPNPQTESMRALFDALVDWTVSDVEPPMSRYPKLVTGELVRPSARAMGFPAIPGRPLPDHLLNPLLDYDFGSRFDANTMSGQLKQPPVIRGVIPSLVPRVDSDGNEVGGAPSIQHLVPLGSYLGWNVKGSGYYHNRASGFFGGFIPFARTEHQRLDAHDPRPSLTERYGDHAGFVAAVRRAAAQLVDERLLLEHDAERIIREAEQSTVLSD